jgi:hypothetical protein
LDYITQLTKWYTNKCIWNTCRTLVGNKYKCTIYCRSICSNIVLYFLFKKIEKSITQKMKILLNKCKHEQIETYECIKKLRNAFLNAQQMSIQQTIHITLSIPLYH